MPDDLEDVILENAEGPQSVDADGVRVAQHGLRDQIEADAYLARRRARRDPRYSLMRFQICPPGAV